MLDYVNRNVIRNNKPEMIEGGTGREQSVVLVK